MCIFLHRYGTMVKLKIGYCSAMTTNAHKAWDVLMYHHLYHHHNHQYIVNSAAVSGESQSMHAEYNSISLEHHFRSICMLFIAEIRWNQYLPKRSLLVVNIYSNVHVLSVFIHIPWRQLKCFEFCGVFGIMKLRYKNDSVWSSASVIATPFMYAVHPPS